MDNTLIYALAEIASFPEHEIIGLESREILLNGGGLHCISQQVPARA